MKYRSAHTGSLTVHFRSVWNDRNDTHAKPSDKEAVDVVCVYCPQSDSCYYLRPQEHGRSVTLRLAPPANRQRARVLLAGHFSTFPPRAGARLGPDDDHLPAPLPRTGD